MGRRSFGALLALCWLRSLRPPQRLRRLPAAPAPKVSHRAPRQPTTPWQSSTPRVTTCHRWSARSSGSGATSRSRRPHREVPTSSASPSCRSRGGASLAAYERWRLDRHVAGHVPFPISASGPATPRAARNGEADER